MSSNVSIRKKQPSNVGPWSGAVTLAGGWRLSRDGARAAALNSRRGGADPQTRAKRFGVNLIPAATDPALLEAELAACLELSVPVIALFWDLRRKSSVA